MIRHPQYPLVYLRQVGGIIVLTAHVPSLRGGTFQMGGHVIRAEYDCEPSFIAEVNQHAAKMHGMVMLKSHIIQRRKHKEID